MTAYVTVVRTIPRYLSKDSIVAVRLTLINLIDQGIRV